MSSSDFTMPGKQRRRSGRRSRLKKALISGTVRVPELKSQAPPNAVIITLRDTLVLHTIDNTELGNKDNYDTSEQWNGLIDAQTICGDASSLVGYLHLAEAYNNCLVQSVSIRLMLKRSLSMTAANRLGGCYLWIYVHSDQRTSVAPQWSGAASSEKSRSIQIDHMKQDPQSSWAYLPAILPAAQGLTRMSANVSLKTNRIAAQRVTLPAIAKISSIDIMTLTAAGVASSIAAPYKFVWGMLMEDENETWQTTNELQSFEVDFTLLKKVKFFNPAQIGALP